MEKPRCKQESSIKIDLKKTGYEGPYWICLAEAETSGGVGSL
jgi:hypothetical protein